ncbi:unnamed protein product [Caenorhabditis angaria]|uniref:Peptidase M12B domain-containing protein n=1 Tax=Caenorhabditis angaria TaxID=860376 RepID=A0A9P1NB53_9PELO|nr:unnamed protein product [Caenorhabditis angaria]
MELDMQLLFFIFTFFASFIKGSEIVYIDYGAAVWGAKAPDYGLASANDGTTIFMRGVIFVDNKTTSFYEYDMTRVKLNIMKMVDEANKYLNQLSVGIIITAIYQTNRGDLSLQSFQEYRNARLNKLPEHEFATLISYKYAGGLAYVNGMCSSHSVSLSGFYPNEPRAMGSIFFHEIAHLVGVPHRAINESIYVPNCACTPKDAKGEEGCLRIPGFDHDCTVQQFVNVVYKNKCLPQKEPIFDSSEPVCGNGVIEEGEDCDCGLATRCSDLNCRPHTCQYQVHPFFLIFAIVSVILFLIGVTFWIVGRYTSKMLNCFKKIKTKHDKNSSPYHNGQIQILAASPYQSRKMSHSSGTGSSSILVSTDSRFATIQRPKMPPPPPPPKTTIQVVNNGGLNETTKMFGSYRESFYDDFSDEEFDDMETPSSYPLPTGVPTCPAYPPKAPINRVTVDLQSPRNNSTATTSNSTTSFSF